MSSEAPAEIGFLSGGGAMGALIRAHDWSATPLGKPETWPETLRSALSLCLHSTLPTSIYWGEDLRLLYNDAWAPIPGARHPAALGRAARDVWSDIWHVIEPQFSRVTETGEGFSTRDQMLPMLRDGQIEETYWDYAFVPIIGSDGRVAGVFNSGSETTPRILVERRQSFLLALSDRLRGLSDPREIMHQAAESLGGLLGVGRVGYAEIDEAEEYVTVERDWTDGRMPSFAGRHRLADYGPAIVEEFKAGRSVRIDDTRKDARMPDPGVVEAYAATGMRAGLALPLIKHGRFTAALYAHGGEPRRWKDAEIGLAHDVAERTWEALQRARAEAALRESEARFRHMADNSSVMVWVTDPTGYCSFLSRSWCDFTGQTLEEGLGFGWGQAVHPDDRAFALETFVTANRNQQRFEVDYRLRRHDGVYRWAIDAAVPRMSESGAFLGYVGSVIDFTDRKEAEERQKLLLEELSHRVKNNLATVRSIASQSFREDKSPRAAYEAFEGRLGALAHAHTLLAESDWRGVGLDEVVRAELAAHPTSTLAFNGCDFVLRPRAALTLGMIMHELVSNAVQHGALSAPDGRVEVSCIVERDAKEGMLRLTWRESGGPPVQAPGRSGFGHTLIQRGIRHELKGDARLDFRPQGLVCEIDLPMAEASA